MTLGEIAERCATTDAEQDGVCEVEKWFNDLAELTAAAQP
jgi:hypothetical protein